MRDDEYDEQRSNGRADTKASAGNALLDSNSTEARGSGAPEPPLNWSPPEGSDGRHEHSQTTIAQNAVRSRTGVIGKVTITLATDEVLDFESARKLISASQITAIISLFFGGILLSSVAVFLASSGFMKLARIAKRHEDNALASKALRKSGAVALAMSLLALAINIVTLIVFYPLLEQMMQQGDFFSLFGGQGGATSSGTSVGSSLFG